jgi:hypothetical protein
MQKHEQTSTKRNICKHCTNFAQKGLTKGSKHGIIKASKETLVTFDTERMIL